LPGIKISALMQAVTGARPPDTEVISSTVLAAGTQFSQSCPSLLKAASCKERIGLAASFIHRKTSKSAYGKRFKRKLNTKPTFSTAFYSA
jgi:hypothetical protein